MDKEHLDELLKQLHAELHQIDTMDEARRKILRDLMAEIQSLLKRSDAERRRGYRSLLEQLQRAIVHFEGSHPKAALAITQVINALVKLGV